ncbi:ADP-ribosylation factor-like protein 2-binding protein isoform X3 [Vidua macroura]|uniref:ADP-ribosylation factor-like protein 2-binding protein isoform X3 n=1 Tax=Vidua macroura TaxID=187451 RepID=UPI0023A7E7D8|nr:ADP-ribosylation factor-like protein 2-binding protein isoform X3 [Vidua macroura]
MRISMEQSSHQCHGLFCRLNLGSSSVIFSTTSDEFDAVVGYLEDIIMDDDFQLIQRNFLEKHYQEFDDSEENKLIYTDIFNEYIPSKKGAALCLRAGVRTEPATPTEESAVVPSEDHAECQEGVSTAQR